VYGTAVVLDGPYEGYDEIYLIGDDGNGEEVCRVRVAVTSTTSRTDCEDCDWAFDVVYGAAEVVTDVDSACEVALELDKTALAALEGTEMAYGYNPDYIGHAKVLMTYAEDGVWTPAAYATYDELTGAFSYDREIAIVKY
jgi:hypothetical protein